MAIPGRAGVPCVQDAATIAEARRYAIAAMGTRFELVLIGDDEVQLRSAAEEALASVRTLSEQLNAFSPSSTLSYINANAATRPIPLDRELFELLDTCRAGWLSTEGAFDITVGPLMEAWGFRGRPSSPEAIGDTRARVGMDNVELDRARGTIRFAVPGMRLDLGGIAKGYALDAAARVLRNAGVTQALMHGGTSSVIAIGSPPGQEAWHVRAGDDTLLLRDAALSVSAPRGRTLQTDQGLIGHVLDPRTGSPTSGASLAWALCESATWAEIWSTALLVLRHRPPMMPGNVRSAVILSEVSA
jgi:thiamine biosynthesis lipoprotein